MTAPYADPQVIRNALAVDRIAIVGLSPNPARPSNEVALYLQQAGYTIVPVNPGHQEILGERCYASLPDIPQVPPLVDVFRASDAVPGIAREAVAAGARCLWLQLGVISEEGAQIALAGGMSVVMDRCNMIEHARLA